MPETWPRQGDERTLAKSKAGHGPRLEDHDPEVGKVRTIECQHAPDTVCQHHRDEPRIEDPSSGHLLLDDQAFPMPLDHRLVGEQQSKGALDLLDRRGRCSYLAPEPVLRRRPGRRRPEFGD